jgi:hypothetical protein
MGNLVELNRYAAPDQVLMTCSHADKFRMSHPSHDMSFPQKMNIILWYWFVAVFYFFFKKLTSLLRAMLQPLVPSRAQLFEN